MIPVQRRQCGIEGSVLVGNGQRAASKFCILRNSQKACPEPAMVVEKLCYRGALCLVHFKKASDLPPFHFLHWGD